MVKRSIRLIDKGVIQTTILRDMPEGERELVHEGRPYKITRDARIPHEWAEESIYTEARPTDQVTVWSYQKWSIRDDCYVPAPSKSMAARIREMDCEIIPGTDELVSFSSLDEFGRYFPRG